MNKKTVLSILLVCVLLTTGVLGAWKLSLSGNGITGEVTSQRGGVMMVQKDFDPINILETTNSSTDFNTHAEIKNNNGVMNFTLELTEVFDDEPDECTDYANDITTTFKWNGEAVSNNETVTLNSGVNILNMSSHIVMQACPGNYSVNWGLVE